MAAWDRAHRKILERGDASRKNLDGDWTNLPSVMFKMGQPDVFAACEATQ